MRTTSIGAVAVLLAMVAVATWVYVAPRTLYLNARDPDTSSTLRVVQGRIVDSQGRTVLLHGFNVDALTDPRDDELGAPSPLDDQDAALMEDAGFDCVRLPIAWSLLEPSPHRFSAAYLRRVRNAVQLLERHGLRVLLDMHFGQSWGPTGDVPAWLMLRSLPAWQVARGRRWGPSSSPRNLASYGYFWLSDAWQQDLAQAWRVVAGQFRDDPALVGYDLINEPHPIPIPPGVFETRFLFPAYARLIRSVAAVDPNHLFVVEATLFFGLPTQVEPIRGASVVYSPQLYVGSITQMPQEVPTPALVGAELTMRGREARTMGAPLWYGEEGADLASPRGRQLENDYLTAINAQGASWSWWEWRGGDGWGIRNDAGTTLNLPALQRLAWPYLGAAPTGVEARATGVASLLVHVRPDHADVPAVVNWPQLLAGAPHAVGNCLASQSWNAHSDRLRLVLTPRAGCIISVR
jgi:endoglycosylceramidase